MREAHQKLLLVFQGSQYNAFLITKIKCPLSNANEVERMHLKSQKGHLNVVNSSSDTNSMSIGYELMVSQQFTLLQVHSNLLSVP